MTGNTRNPLLDALKTMNGRDQLQHMIDGNFPGPSIGRTMNFRLTSVDDGEAVFTGNPGLDHMNPLGTVHGGWPATILDTALACAVHTTLKPGETYTTVEFKVNLVRPIMPDSGEVTCTGHVISRGRRIATSEAKLVNAEGKLLAHGSETCIIMPLQAG